MIIPLKKNKQKTDLTIVKTFDEWRCGLWRLLRTFTLCRFVAAALLLLWRGVLRRLAAAPLADYGATPARCCSSCNVEIGDVDYFAELLNTSSLLLLLHHDVATPPSP